MAITDRPPIACFSGLPGFVLLVTNDMDGIVVPPVTPSTSQVVIKWRERARLLMVISSEGP